MEHCARTGPRAHLNEDSDEANQKGADMKLELILDTRCLAQKGDTFSGYCSPMNMSTVWVD